MAIISELLYRQKGYDQLYNQKHFHDDTYELVHVIAGSGSIVINNHIFPLGQGDVCLIDGAVLHCSIPDDSANYIRSKLFISKRKTNELLTALGALKLQNMFYTYGGTHIKLDPQQSGHVDRLLVDLCTVADQSGPGEGLYTASKVLELLSVCAGNLSESRYQGGKITLKSISYIHDNIAGELSIDAIAKSLYVSKYYLCHKFKEDTKMTVSRYIRNLRISLAKQKLVQTDLSVSQIAGAVGFSNFSYFSKTFSEVIGVSPSEFRKKAVGFQSLPSSGHP